MRWLVAALVLVAACSKKDESPAGSRPEPIGEVERQRGDEACRAYVERLCACAAARPDDQDLKERCELKPAKLEAINLALMVDDNPAANARDVWQAQDQVRKIIAKCIEENVQLDKECP